MENSSKRRGRPRKTEDEQNSIRDNRIVLRLDDSTIKRLRCEAEVKGVNMTTLAASMVAKSVEKLWPECKDEVLKMYDFLFEK